MLQHIEVEAIGSGVNKLCTDIATFHLPGHSPDCLAVILGEEAVIVGDILLPQITPWPTRLEMYGEIAGVVGHIFPEPKEIFRSSSLSTVFKAAQTPGYGASGYAGASSAPFLL